MYTSEDERYNIYNKLDLNIFIIEKIENFIESDSKYCTTIKLNKYSWHREYHKLCCLIYDHTCNLCRKFCYPNQLVMHHISYYHKKGIYNIDLFEAINKIELLCKDCHKWIHQNFVVDKKTKIIDEEKNCIDCNCLFNDNDLNINGRCEDCEFHYKRQMNEYLF